MFYATRVANQIRKAKGACGLAEQARTDYVTFSVQMALSSAAQRQNDLIRRADASGMTCSTRSLRGAGIPVPDCGHHGA